MSGPNDGFSICTHTSAKEFTIEIVELTDKPFLSESLLMQKRRYENILCFWDALDKYVSELLLEELLGVPVRYKIPLPYSKVFKWVNQHLDIETLFSKQSEL